MLFPETKYVERDYQTAALQEIRSLYDNGKKRVLLPMATGLGKTVAFSFLPDYFPELFEQGMLVLVHREELVHQAVQKLESIHRWVPVGIEQAHNRTTGGAHIVVASVQTLGRKDSSRIRKFEGRFGIVVVDEAHHISMGSQYERVLDAFGLTPASTSTNGDLERLLVGVTATPNRHDGRGLAYFFDELATNLDLRWGVENGWLTDIHGYKIDTPADISDVGTSRGDFVISQLEKKVNTHERHDVIVKAYQEYGGNCGLAFCTSIQHAVDLAEAFRICGHDAECVHSKMDHEERVDIIQRYRNGHLEILTNVGIATEGFDVPRIDTLLMARPTKSSLLYQQCIGRGTRPVIELGEFPTAEDRILAIKASEKPFMRVIDFTDNSGKHDLITLPTLFGMTKRYDYEGKSAIETERHIEGQEKIYPTKNLRNALNLADVKVIATTLSMWELAAKDEVGEGLSDFSWIHMQGGSAQLVIPGSLKDKRVSVIRINPDRLGRYNAEMHKLRTFDDNAGVMLPAETIPSTKLYPNKQDAILACDKWVRKTFPGVVTLIYRHARWRNASASDAQRRYVHKLYGQLPPPELTKGEAAQLINRAKAEKVTPVKGKQLTLGDS